MKKGSNINLNKISNSLNNSIKLHIQLNHLSKNKTSQQNNIPRKNRPSKLNYPLTNTYYFNNKSINLNLDKSNHGLLNTTDFNLKENLEKNKQLRTLESYHYIMKATNIERLNTLNINNNEIYNRLIPNKNKLSLLNRDYYLNNKKTRKKCSSLNKNNQNININNNIIININNNNNNSNTNSNNNINNTGINDKFKTYNDSKNKKNSKLIKKIKQNNKVINKENPNKKNFIENSPKKYINLDKIKNPQIPKDYLNIIYYNLLTEEQKGIKPMVLYNYMTDQNEINEQMRSILIDWLIDVHHKFQFRDETLFMTVLIIDRFCTIRQISRIKLQLLGVTAMMIACKHEEIELPKIEDFIFITDKAYTKEEIIKLENDILIALNFELMYPSPIKFFEYLSVNFNFDKKAHFMGKYLMESFLLDIKYVKYKASVISCACAYIVMKFFKIEGYQDFYSKKYFMLNENEDLPLGHGVKDCAQDICILVDNIKNSNYLSCFKKYSKEEFEKVAQLIENIN